MNNVLLWLLKLLLLFRFFKTKSAHIITGFPINMETKWQLFNRLCPARHSFVNTILVGSQFKHLTPKTTSLWISVKNIFHFNADPGSQNVADPTEFPKLCTFKNEVYWKSLRLKCQVLGLESCHKLWISNSYIIAPRCRIGSNNLSLNYQKFTPSGCKYMWQRFNSFKYTNKKCH